MNHGYIRVAAAIPELKLADCHHNILKMADIIADAAAQQVSIISFPELSVTGYTCGDLFFQQEILEHALAAVEELLLKTYSYDITAIVGMPLRVDQQLYNVAVVMRSGNILGIVPKTHLPNNNEFYEKRWFASGRIVKSQFINFNGSEVAFGSDLLFTQEQACFGIEICEDLWVPLPPSTQLCLQGADIIFNLSATNELIGKHQYLRQLISQQSARTYSGYVYASAGFGESSTDVVYAGNALISENGIIIAASDRFSFKPQLIISEIDVEKLHAERLRNSNFFADRTSPSYRRIIIETAPPKAFSLTRAIDRYPFVPPTEQRNAHCEEIFSIQVGGLAQRWHHTKAQSLVVGISGGLDSTLALLVCVKTADKLGWDRKKIIGITMPGFGTSDRTYQNALQLMKSLGITQREIPIADACLQHFKDIGHDGKQHDITYENTQARERTQILMNVANQTNGLVVGTGDLSELALGWATYNGDHMSMYGVNSGIPKTLVRNLVDWASRQLDEQTGAVLQDVLKTPVSPELLPAASDGTITQKTEDVVGPYELHDFFLYYFIRFGFRTSKILYLAKKAFDGIYTEDVIQNWLNIFMKRFYNQQFKRSCMPDGPKVGSINLSPRGDWRMPSDAHFS